MKKKRRLPVIVLSLLLIFIFVTQTVSATMFVGTADRNSISPTPEMLKSVKTTYSGKQFTNIPQTIDSPYELSIIKYKCTENLQQLIAVQDNFGNRFTHLNTYYYCAYTTDRFYDDWGVWDTVGQVYQLDTTGILWWKKDIAVPVTDKDIADDAGHNFNYRAVFPAITNKTYYICTRAYNKGEAYSYLHIKPNDDEMYSKKGGTWIASASDLKHYSAIEGTRAAIVNKKVYFNKEQTLEYYKLICCLELNAASLRGAAQKGFAYQFRKVLELVNNRYSFISAFIDLPIDEINDIVLAINSGIESLTTTQLNYLAEAGPELKELIDALQDIADFNTTDQMDSQKDALETQCGCSHHGSAFEFTNSHGCVITTTVWVAADANTSTVYAQYGTNVNKELLAYDSYYLYGEKYAKGEWNIEDWDDEWR